MTPEEDLAFSYLHGPDAYDVEGDLEARLRATPLWELVRSARDLCCTLRRVGGYETLLTLPPPVWVDCLGLQEASETVERVLACLGHARDDLHYLARRLPDRTRAWLLSTPGMWPEDQRTILITTAGRRRTP